MIKVFIAGSRRLSCLDNCARLRVDNIINKGLKVLVGDANGIDRAIQSHLYMRGYRNVEIFCMDSGCRNNIGDWPKRIISAPGILRFSFAYYSSKDKAMATEADYGLMLWDGNSRGTLRNIIDLVKKGIPLIIYIDSKKKFYTIRNSKELHDFLMCINPNGFQSTLNQFISS